MIVEQVDNPLRAQSSVSRGQRSVKYTRSLILRDRLSRSVKILQSRSSLPVGETRRDTRARVANSAASFSGGSSAIVKKKKAISVGRV